MRTGWLFTPPGCAIHGCGTRQDITVGGAWGKAFASLLQTFGVFFFLAFTVDQDRMPVTREAVLRRDREI
jgi:hypothetical protein